MASTGRTPLGTSRAWSRADNRAAAQPVLVKLADALVGDGDTVAALDTLRLAATYGWRPQVYDAAAAIWLSKGDTAQALRSYAKVAVDPASPPTYGDSIKAALALRLDGAAWTSWLKAAEDEMRGAVLARAAPRSLGVAVRLKTADGRILSLGDLSGGKVTLVTFWSRTCGPAVRQLPEIAAVASRVTRSGAAVVTVTKEPVTADLRAFLKARGAENLPVAFDYQNEARRAFGNFATPEFYVLDAAGRVVFAHTTLEAIPRQVAALLP